MIETVTAPRRAVTNCRLEVGSTPRADEEKEITSARRGMSGT